MKKFLLFAAVAVLTLTGAGKKDKSAFSKENGATVVNTTEICKSVDGYNGPVPVKIYIRKNKVKKIEMLNNQEGQIRECREEALARSMERAGHQRGNNQRSRCRHWCHLHLEGFHRERPTGPGLLSEEQITD